ncbi:unnamed protein product [Spirodela intermedia]|uniref:Core Histone H2A/H2B/H3 domain-containing protein n=2 Tax=Spirodela intermedia TaxID=51605 RepID=A0A7I8K3Y7_SPIIN|nr:unnamed protein product [Spirodela intermedia]
MEEVGVEEKTEQRQPPDVETISGELAETAAAPEGEKHAVEKSRQREDETQPTLESEEQPPQFGEERKSVEEDEEAKKEKVEGDIRAEETAGGKGRVETKSAMRRRKRKRAGGDVGGFGGMRGYKRYVFRVLKQVHPELRVSSMAMTVLDSLVKDMFERLAGEASRLSKYSGRATLSTREIQAAVRLVLPRELGEHALAEGNKAVANFMTAAADKVSS